MTIVLAIKVKSGDMVLVADRLSIDGDPRGNSQPEENCTKVLKFHNGAIGIAGCIGVAIRPLENAISIIEKDADQDPIDIIRKEMLDFYSKSWPAKDPEIADIKLAVVCSYRGANRICSLESNYFVPELKEDHIVLGMPDYARRLYRRFWYPELEIKEATELAVFLAMDTGRVEIKVGKGRPDVIKVINGIADIVHTSDIDEIAKTANARMDAFANIFRKPATAPTA